MLSVQELIKQEKQLAFGPTLTLIFLIFGKCEIGKLHIFKKFGLSTFKEILQKCVYNSTCMFFNVFSFSLKGYSETLNWHKLFLSQLQFLSSFCINFQMISDTIGQSTFFLLWKILFCAHIFVKIGRHKFFPEHVNHFVLI